MLKLKTRAGSAAGNRQARRAARRKNRPTPTPGAPARLSALRHLRTALEHQQAGKIAESERSYREVLALEPDNAAAHFGIGVLASRTGNHSDAYIRFKQAVTLDPEKAAYWSALAHTLTVLGQYPAAVIACQNAVERQKDDPDLLVKLAWACFHDCQAGDALAAYDRALEVDGRFLPALLGKGQQLYSMGDLAAARQCFETVLEVDPSNPDAIFRLVDIEPEEAVLEDLTRRAMRGVTRREAEKDISRLHFAAGKGLKRMKRYDEAFQCFAAGNAAVRARIGFDRDTARKPIDETISAFGPEVFERLAEAASDTRLPVFIVGMPRSGSTLVEQIISSHPVVADAGEFPKLLNTVRTLMADSRGRLRYPHDIAEFEPAPLAALGADYLEALQRGQPAAAVRITDKLLENFANIGLIHILFPNAAIIHCRRDPMDSCLSSFTQMFAAAQHLAYTNDLADLGFYYRQYQRLMAHWREVLPGRMFEVEYEQMVQDQEGMSRRLIGHLGLEWDDACLDFHKTARSVRTASVGQVRKPVYASSVGGWRKYEKHLGPLREALEAGG